LGKYGELFFLSYYLSCKIEYKVYYLKYFDVVHLKNHLKCKYYPENICKCFCYLIITYKILITEAIKTIQQKTKATQHFYANAQITNASQRLRKTFFRMGVCKKWLREKT